VQSPKKSNAYIRVCRNDNIFFILVLAFLNAKSIFVYTVKISSSKDSIVMKSKLIIEINPLWFPLHALDYAVKD
jgi:hypothetical protein